jgi:cytochrome b6-f complex iron-sulfur subunit
MNEKRNDPSSQKGSQASEQVSRRSFLDLIFSGAILLTIITILGAIIRFLIPHGTSSLEGKRVLVGDLAHIQVGSSFRRVLKGQGVLIIRTRTGFYGLSLTCTHRGCNVDWDQNRKIVVCPCHGGTFDLEGNVLGGPPPRPLNKYDVRVVDDKVYVEG